MALGCIAKVIVVAGIAAIDAVTGLFWMHLFVYRIEQHWETAIGRLVLEWQKKNNKNKLLMLYAADLVTVK